jgi:hypothetical protein
MASLARARAQGQPDHRHLAVGALHVVVLKLATTSSVTPTASVSASCKAPRHQRRNDTPGGCLARRSKRFEPAPSDHRSTSRELDLPAPFRQPRPARDTPPVATPRPRNATTLRADRVPPAIRAVRSWHLGSRRAGHRGKHPQRSHAHLPFAASPSGQRPTPQRRRSRRRTSSAAGVCYPKFALTSVGKLDRAQRAATARNHTSSVAGCPSPRRPRAHSPDARRVVDRDTVQNRALNAAGMLVATGHDVNLDRRDRTPAHRHQRSSEPRLDHPRVSSATNADGARSQQRQLRQRDPSPRRRTPGSDYRRGGTHSTCRRSPRRSRRQTSTRRRVFHRQSHDHRSRHSRSCTQSPVHNSRRSCSRRTRTRRRPRRIYRSVRVRTRRR